MSEIMPVEGADLERVVEPSRIRRGRYATSPVWYVPCSSMGGDAVSTGNTSVRAGAL